MSTAKQHKKQDTTIEQQNYEKQKSNLITNSNKVLQTLAKQNALKQSKIKANSYNNGGVTNTDLQYQQNQDTKDNITKVNSKTSSSLNTLNKNHKENLDAINKAYSNTVHRSIAKIIRPVKSSINALLREQAK